MCGSKKNQRGYKEHIKKVYLESEKARIPDTMDVISKYKQIPQLRADGKVEREKIKSIRVRCKMVQDQMEKPKSELYVLIANKGYLSNKRSVSTEKDEKLKLYREIREHTEKIKVLKGQMETLKESFLVLEEEKNDHRCILAEIVRTISRIEGSNGDESSLEKKEKKRYIFPCPLKNCRGLVESKSFKCEICGAQTCRMCRMYKEMVEKHVCDKDDLESVKLIREDTKPCPKCTTPIYKIDGCDQMFCPTCKSGFSWKTGKLEKGKMHNPHWYEWMRSNGKEINRDPGDIPCGGVPRLYRIMSHDLNRINGNAANMEIVTVGDLSESYKNLRIKYLTGELTEIRWEQQIYNRKRLDEREEILVEMWRLLANVAADVFRKLEKEMMEKGGEWHRNKRAHVVERSCLNKLEKIRLWGNNLILEEMSIIGFKKPSLLDKTWHLTRCDYVSYKNDDEEIIVID
jgi:hypothetical protein